MNQTKAGKRRLQQVERDFNSSYDNEYYKEKKNFYDDDFQQQQQQNYQKQKENHQERLFRNQQIAAAFNMEEEQLLLSSSSPLNYEQIYEQEEEEDKSIQNQSSSYRLLPYQSSSQSILSSSFNYSGNGIDRKNNRHPVKNVHLSYKGHYKFDNFPFAYKQLAYCFEVGKMNQTKHTHVLLQLEEKETKVNMLKALQPLLKEKCQLDLKAHPRFETMVKYHYGLLSSKKFRCPNIQWETEFNFEEWVKACISHKAYNNKERQERNKLIESMSIPQLVDEGIIHIHDVQKYKQAKQVLESERQVLQEQQIPDLQDYLIQFKGGVSFRIDINPANKKRHTYVFGETDSGKSFPFQQLLAQEGKQVKIFEGVDKANLTFDDLKPSTQLLVFDEFKKGTLNDNVINAIAGQGGYTFKRKYQSNIRLSKYQVVICSEQCMDCTFPNINGKKSSLRNRFNQVNLTDPDETCIGISQSEPHIGVQIKKQFQQQQQNYYFQQKKKKQIDLVSYQNGGIFQKKQVVNDNNNDSNKYEMSNLDNDFPVLILKQQQQEEEKKNTTIISTNNSNLMNERMKE